MRNARILIVDDDARLRRMLAALLAAAGYDVRVAGDGAGALAAVRRERPDLVLLDVLMPGMDGRALSRALRADGHGDLPLVVLTGLAAADVRRDFPGVPVLTKPFRPDELLEAVRACLERPPGAPSPPSPDPE